MSIGRHLLPHEFDLLVDDEVGFGIPPLSAHVRECAQCSAELDAARGIVDRIERLPHLTPSPLFAERVMPQVHVFRPWHAAALESARRLVPQPGPFRTAVAAGLALTAVTLTGSAMWAATRVDSFLLLLGLLVEQARRATMEVATTLLGAEALATLQAGGLPILLITLTVIAASAIFGVAWITRAARAARVRR